MDRLTWLAKAKEGDADAIATLITQALGAKGITARAERQTYRLMLWLEAATPPSQAAAVAYVRQGMERLQVTSIGTVQIYGQQPGQPPAWSEEISLLGISGSQAILSASPASPPATESAREAVAPAQISRPEASISSAIAPAFSQGARAKTTVTASKQPLVIQWSDFEPMKTAIILFVAVYGFLGARNPGLDGPFMLIHLPDLAIHETGHLLFMPFGRFLHILGGSLTQILFPAVFTVYFFWSKQFFSSALTLFWTGQNFMDVAVYMADAPYRELPLTVDDPDAHDWYNLFNMMSCMNQAELIAGIMHWIGVLLYGVAIAAGLYFIRVETLALRQHLAQINGQDVP